MQIKQERLLYTASQAIGSAAGTGILAVMLVSTPLSAQTQYAVSDVQLQSSVTTALHNDVKLSSAAITVSTVQGVVTLTGNAGDEEARVEAEQVVAGVSGVRSIQDNISIGSATDGNGATGSMGTAPVPAVAQDTTPGTAQNAPQDTARTTTPQSLATPPAPPAEPGTAAVGGMPPAPPDEQSLNHSANQQYTPYPNGSGQAQGTQNNYPGETGSAQNYPNQNYPNQNYPNQNYPAQNYPDPSQGQYPNQYPGQYPVPNNSYPQQDSVYGPRGNARVPQSPSNLGVSPQQQDDSGPVSISPGTLLSVRTTQPLSTNNLRGGEYFQVTAAMETYANGVVAIPRGAILTGEVVEARNAGPLGGSPRLDLRLTSIQLGAVTYPVATEVWSSQGPNKAGYTAANTIGGAAVGALIGAVAGGGVGAGIGAIAGGATGAVVSGATHGPRLDLPPEALLQFHLVQPLTVQPVPFEEAERLATILQPVLRQRPLYVAVPYPGRYVRPYPYAYYPYGPYRYYPRY